MFKLLKYMKKHKWIALTAPFFKLLECTFELMVPLVMKNIIDKGIPSSDINSVIHSCFILFLLAIVGFSCTVMAQYFAARSSAMFVRDVKHATFDHIQSLSYSQLDKLTTSSLITRMTSDMNQVQTGTNLTLRLLLRSPFIVFGAVVMAFIVNKDQASIFVVAVPILFAIVITIMVACLPLYRKVQSQLDVILRKTRENLTGVRVIRAFNLEEQEKEKYDDETDVLNRLQQHVGRISNLMNPLTYVVVNVSIVALLYTGAIKVNSGLLSKGEIIALYNYMSQILVELIKLTSLVITITKSIASGNRIQEILETEPSIISGNTDLSECDIAVEFDNVSLSYHSGAEEALHDVSFTVRKGSTVGLIGSTGSGKSSVINLIPRYYDCSEGTVRINGSDSRSLNTDSLRRSIGTVPQKAVLFKGTVRSNLLWGNEEASDEELIEALKLAQAYDFIAGKDGLNTVVEQGGSNFSGGQRQRLTIARALVRKPQILILDDSTSALDYATEAKLRSVLKNLPYECTTFIVSQRTGSIKHADLILVMDDGDLVGKGTHQQLLKECEVYQEIYYSQYQKEETAYA